MAAFYTATNTATNTTTTCQPPLCVLAYGSPFALEKKPASLLVSKPPTTAVETARAASPAVKRGVDFAADDDDDDAESEKYWAFVRKHFPKEKRLYVALKNAKKALKKCKDDAREAALRCSFVKASSAYKRYVAKADAAYEHSLREYASESDYAPSWSDAEVDEEAEADACYAPSDAEEEPEEAPADADEHAPKKSSKRKFSGPAVGPVKKAVRAKRGSKPLKPLPGGCGCSCGGVHCGHATATPEVRYDKSTQRTCCDSCGQMQYKAMSFLFGSKNPAFKYTIKSVCWLNQCEEVRVLGLGGGRQAKNRKAAAAVAAAEEEC